MGVIYKNDDCCDSYEVADLFRISGIRRTYDDFDRINRMLTHADEIITARDGEKLIGLLRAITDYSYCCYICDIAVDLNYQNRGIGRELIKRLQEKVGNDEIQYVLTSGPQAIGFYEKNGFERAEKAFIIKRKKI